LGWSWSKIHARRRRTTTARVWRAQSMTRAGGTQQPWEPPRGTRRKAERGHRVKPSETFRFRRYRCKKQRRISSAQIAAERYSGWALTQPLAIVAGVRLRQCVECAAGRGNMLHAPPLDRRYLRSLARSLVVCLPASGQVGAAGGVLRAAAPWPQDPAAAAGM